MRQGGYCGGEVLDVSLLSFQGVIISRETLYARIYKVRELGSWFHGGMNQGETRTRPG